MIIECTRAVDHHATDLPDGESHWYEFSAPFEANPGPVFLSAGVTGSTVFKFTSPMPLGFEAGQQFELALIPIVVDEAGQPMSTPVDSEAPAGPPKGAVLVERLGLLASLFAALHAIVSQLVGGPVDVDG